MNRVVLMGRLTRDPEIRYTTGERQMAIARYTIAVDRRGKEKATDYIPCVAFDRAGEFAEKYFRQGMRVLVSGRIQTGSYTNREGRKIYTTEVILEEQEFADSKQTDPQFNPPTEDRRKQPENGEDFMVVPDNVDEAGLPFN